MPHTPQRLGSTDDGLAIVSDPKTTTTPESAHEHNTLTTLVATAMTLGWTVSPAPCSAIPPTIITDMSGMLMAMMCTNSVA